MKPENKMLMIIGAARTEFARRVSISNGSLFQHRTLF